MEYPIVQIKTPDNLILYGLISKPKEKTDTAFLFIHGTASNFYCEDFIKNVTEKLNQNNVAVLATNNRGAGIGESWQKTGAAVELFEDCVIDIDCWIEYLETLGFTKIILAGHSLGTEKVVYYMNKGKYVNKVISVMLLGFADSYGTHYKFINSQNINPMEEAHKLVKEGKGYQYLTTIWNAHAGVLPQSAESYINFFSVNSELSKAFPIRNGKDLKLYQNINVPIFAAISDGKEYTVIPTNTAIELLRTENQNAHVYKILNSAHCFENKENEIADLISKFINKINK